jgi:hypothetical protein
MPDEQPFYVAQPTRDDHSVPLAQDVARSQGVGRTGNSKKIVGGAIEDADTFVSREAVEAQGKSPKRRPTAREAEAALSSKPVEGALQASMIMAEHQGNAGGAKKGSSSGRSCCAVS